MGTITSPSSRPVSYPTASDALADSVLMFREVGPQEPPKPRLLDRVREAIRARHILDGYSAGQRGRWPALGDVQTDAA